MSWLTQKGGEVCWADFLSRTSTADDMWYQLRGQDLSGQLRL